MQREAFRIIKEGGKLYDPQQTNVSCSVLSTAMFLVLACVWLSSAAMTAKRKSVSQAAPARSLELQAQGTPTRPQKNRRPGPRHSFREDQDRFHKMAASPVLKSTQAQAGERPFLEVAQGHQPWHSLLRTDKKARSSMR